MSDVPATVVETKPVEVTETPAVPAVTAEPVKTEDTPVTTETPAVVEETAATDTQETPATTEEQKEEVKPVRPKSPGILAKLIAPFKAKLPKSPKKSTVEPPVEEAPKPVETPAAEAATDGAVDPPKEESGLGPVKEAETPAETPAVPEETDKKEKEKEDKKDDKDKKTAKLSHRLSVRVGDFFSRKSRSEVPTTAKVDELPPKIDEPTRVAPLENPATEAAAPAETPAEPSEPAKPVEAAPAATQVVAAAA